jgi:pre-mRNA-splicing factor SPF27
MPLIHDSHDSLPCTYTYPPTQPVKLTLLDIDAAPTASAHARAQQLITAELSSEHSTTLHPWIPALPEPNFTPTMAQELSRKAAGTPLTGIDLSRYEAPEAPTGSDLDAWRETLRKAYTSSVHLSKRYENLALLEEGGRNAWLVGNSQLEDILSSMEKELAEMKEAAEEVNRQRKIAQEASAGELVALEETWKRGVGAILEVEVAAEELRGKILEVRRERAQQVGQ